MERIDLKSYFFPTGNCTVDPWVFGFLGGVLVIFLFPEYLIGVVVFSDKCNMLLLGSAYLLCK